MQRIPLSSSRLASAGYDPATKTMEVEMHEGVIQYFDVPEEEFRKFLNAPSQGKHFYYYIEHNYECRKLEMA
ncbi:MAG: hypothetical protein A2W91_14525 [Bacteroidetes bacterium GWF2_38_335]|nr:MAG: hypothetical protein A2W91_14525 [Bacteroidetes bacterium GWF2_38_335]OFY79404.1 MAG: hypothetical protein A2281_16630 [Bacteroidetes bacterium RIFOXYA12_FULL_38_20]HBS85584.1 KTSC domain-containing protein [Bacteroidales bacterium]